MLNYLELHRYIMISTKTGPEKPHFMRKMPTSWRKLVRGFFKKREKS